jgi:hypothetical protein
MTRGTAKTLTRPTELPAGPDRPVSAYALGILSDLRLESVKLVGTAALSPANSAR